MKGRPPLSLILPTMVLPSWKRGPVYRTPVSDSDCLRRILRPTPLGWKREPIRSKKGPLSSMPTAWRFFLPLKIMCLFENAADRKIKAHQWGCNTISPD